MDRPSGRKNQYNVCRVGFTTVPQASILPLSPGDTSTILQTLALRRRLPPISGFFAVERPIVARLSETPIEGRDARKMAISSKLAMAIRAEDLSEQMIACPA